MMMIWLMMVMTFTPARHVCSRSQATLGPLCLTDKAIMTQKKWFRMRGVVLPESESVSSDSDTRDQLRRCRKGSFSPPSAAAQPRCFSSLGCVRWLWWSSFPPLQCGRKAMPSNGSVITLLLLESLKRSSRKWVEWKFSQCHPVTVHVLMYFSKESLSKHAIP